MSDKRERLLRRLAPSELVYDHEVNHRCHLFVCAVKFTANVDLMRADSRHLFERSITDWVKLNPFLRTCVRNEIVREEFSLDERSFYLQDEKYLNLMANVHFINAKHVKQDVDLAWRQIYEQEFNREPPLKPLLWRLSLVQLDKVDDLFEYVLILNVHHALTDARNTFVVMSQLIGLIDSSWTDPNDSKLDWQETIMPSLEEALFGSDYHKSIYTTMAGTQQDLVSKIPTSLGLNNSNTMEDHVTKFKSFILNEDKFQRIVDKCKSRGVKLTPMLNFIYVMATHEAYQRFAKDSTKADDVYSYHLMVNLRPHLNESNVNMGFRASFLDCELKFKETYAELADDFWSQVKYESDVLHERLKRNEPIEMAKSDGVLLEDLRRKRMFVQGGGVHYALSNLGILSPTVGNSGSFKINEFYYQVSMEAARWSSVIFNGVCSIQGKGLIWGLTYNSNLIRTEVIDFIFKKCLDFFDRLAL